MKPVYIATRGSALALAQAQLIAALCRQKFPHLQFDLKIIKTTGDKLATASLANPNASLPKGLFTKEIEDALLSGEADIAVHSLKDLPTILPEGLVLAATTKREDVRDTLVYRGGAFVVNRCRQAGDGRSFAPGLKLLDLPHGAVIGTNSTRRAAQVRELRPDVSVLAIRGNVGTRLHKLACEPALDAIILASAGLRRLHFTFGPQGSLQGADCPPDLQATILSCDQMLPCVGQAALGLEIRESDEFLQQICRELNHLESWYGIIAERAFLRRVGGGCQSAVAAYAEIEGREIWLRAASFMDGAPRRCEVLGSIMGAAELGTRAADRLKRAPLVMTPANRVAVSP